MEYPNFNPQYFNTSTLKRPLSFRSVSNLKKAKMDMLIKMTDQPQIEELRKDFAIIDKDWTRMISADELKQALEQS